MSLPPSSPEPPEGAAGFPAPVPPQPAPAPDPRPTVVPADPYLPGNPYPPGNPYLSADPYLPPTGSAGVEILPGSVPGGFPASGPGPARPGRRWALLAGVGVLVPVLAVAGGVWAWSAFTDPGDQPERHLPAGTAAMVKIDLDPPGQQKVQALRFAANLPSTRDRSPAQDGDLRRSLYESLAHGSGGSWPSWSKVEPWLGERAAVAVVPTGEQEPVPVIALKVTDEQRAATTLGEIRTDGGTGVAVGDGWAYVSDTAAHARDVLTRTRAASLDTDPTFTADRERLGADGVAAAWFDLARVVSVANRSTSGDGMGGSASLLGLGAQQASGHGAFVLRFSGADLELSGTLRGTGRAGTRSAGTGVQELPADSVLALGIGDAGSRLAGQWSALSRAGGADLAGGLAELERATGLRLPGDAQTLLGTRFAVAMGPGAPGGVPAIGIRGTSSAARLGSALDAVVALARTADVPVHRRSIPGGYVLATTGQQADAIASGGGLGSAERFRRAVPQAASAGVVLYADLTRVADLPGADLDAQTRTSLEGFGAFGVSAGTDGSGGTDILVRLTTR